MLKYDFSIQTRDGQKIESVVIAGRDQEDAERKLRQMYRHCEVLRCDVRSVAERVIERRAEIRPESRPGKRADKTVQAASVEDILSLISK